MGGWAAHTRTFVYIYVNMLGTFTYLPVFCPFLQHSSEKSHACAAACRLSVGRSKTTCVLPQLCRVGEPCTCARSYPKGPPCHRPGPARWLKKEGTDSHQAQRKETGKRARKGELQFTGGGRNKEYQKKRVNPSRTCFASGRQRCRVLLHMIHK